MPIETDRTRARSSATVPSSPRTDNSRGSPSIVYWRRTRRLALPALHPASRFPHDCRLCRSKRIVLVLARQPRCRHLRERIIVGGLRLSCIGDGLGGSPYLRFTPPLASRTTVVYADRNGSYSCSLVSHGAVISANG